MDKRVFISQLDETVSENDLKSIFSRRLNDFKVFVKPGSIEHTKIGFLNWSDRISEHAIINEFRGTKLKGREMELKEYDENYKSTRSYQKKDDSRMSENSAHNSYLGGVRIGDWLDAKVTNFSSYECFHVQLEDRLTDLLELDAAITDAISRKEGKFVFEQRLAYINYLYVATYEDGKWYRVKVLEHHGTEDVLVEYIDFGNREMISFRNLQILPRSMLVKPAFAYHCCLADVCVDPHTVDALNFELKCHLSAECRILVASIQQPADRTALPILHVQVKVNNLDLIDKMVQLNYLSVKGTRGVLSCTSPASSMGHLLETEKTNSRASSEHDSKHGPTYSGDCSYSALQSNNSSVVDKINVIGKGPASVQIVHSNKEKMEVTVRLVNVANRIDKSLKRIFDCKMLSSLSLWPSVNVNQIHLAESGRHPSSVRRVRIEHPAPIGQDNVVPFAQLGKSVTLHFIDDGFQEQREVEGARVKSVYAMPSKSDLYRVIGKEESDLLMYGDGIVKLCHLQWERFNLELPLEKRHILYSEIDQLASKMSLQAEFDEKEEWIEFYYSENSQNVAWKDFLVASGILRVSSPGEGECEDDYEPVKHPEIANIARTLQNIMYQHTGLVTHVSDKGEIYVRLYDDLSRLQLIKNMENGGASSLLPITSPLFIHGVYGALCDGKCKRFRLTFVNSEQAYGQMIDSGCMEWVPISSLRVLPAEAANVPPLAQKYILDDLVGQVVDVNEFKRRLAPSMLNHKVTVVGRESSLQGSNMAAIPFLTMFTTNDDMYSRVSDIIQHKQASTDSLQEDGKISLIEHGILYRLLFSTGLNKILEDLSTEPEIFVEAHKSRQELMELQTKFVNLQTLLKEKVDSESNVKWEDIQSLLDDRKSLAEQIVAASDRVPKLSILSTNETEKKHWKERLAKTEKALLLIQKILNLFLAETSVKGEKTTSEAHLTPSELCQTILSTSVRSQLEELWQATDKARSVVEKLSTKLAKIMRVFNDPSGTILDHGHNLNLPDVSWDSCIQQWHTCLAAEVTFTTHIAASKSADIVACMQALLLRLNQQHTSINEELNNPIGDVIRMAQDLLQSQDGESLKSQLQTIRRQIRKAKAKLFLLRAQFEEIEAHETDEMKRVQEEEKWAIKEIHTLWLEESQICREIIQACEVRPELTILSEDFRSVSRQDGVCTWDAQFIQWRHSYLQNDLYTAVFVEEMVFIKEYRNIPSTTPFNKWLSTYRDICRSNKEETFLPVLALYQTTPIQEIRPPVLSVNVIFPAPNASGAVCFNSSNNVDPLIPPSTLEQLTPRNVQQLLWSALRALRQLFECDEFSTEELPLCWLVPDGSMGDQSSHWKLRVGPPSLLKQKSEEILAPSIDERVRLVLCKFSAHLNVHNHKDLTWIDSLLTGDEFSLNNAEASLCLANVKDPLTTDSHGGTIDEFQCDTESSFSQLQISSAVTTSSPETQAASETNAVHEDGGDPFGPDSSADLTM